jgi:transposase-like protein
MQAFYYNYGGTNAMRMSPVPANEQYRLIMDCRQSGLSDHQWCMLHGIKPGTFYNWVKRLRQSGVTDIPDAAGRATYQPTPKQEVVRVNFNQKAETMPAYEPEQTEFRSVPEKKPDSLAATLELAVNDSRIRVTNDADPVLLARIIQILKGLSC